MKTANIKVDYLGHYGSDLTVVNAARVSFHKESLEFTNADAKLIQYLARHKHFSPFNHSFISVRIKAPIFVARQLVKHRFMPWNEVSRRYVDEEPEFFYPEGWRAKAENVKQGSADVFVDPDTPSGQLNIMVQNAMSHAVDVYNYLLEENVAAEQARMVLPQNMMTEWWWSGTLGAFADMLRLRLDPHTQKESRDVAQLILPIVEEYFPISIKALLNA